MRVHRTGLQHAESAHTKAGVPKYSAASGEPSNNMELGNFIPRRRLRDLSGMTLIPTAITADQLLLANEAESIITYFTAMTLFAQLVLTYSYAPISEDRDDQCLI